MYEKYDKINDSSEITALVPYVGSIVTENSRKRKNTRKKRHSMKIAACLLCSALISGGAGAGGVLYGMNYAASSVGTEQSSSTIQNGQRSSSVLNISYIDTENEMTASEIYAAYVNSTVGITTSSTTNYFGYQTVSAASGSGFIISSDGYIVTNYHVIEDASTITVTSYVNETYEAALIGYDESNDLAILKIDAQDLTPVVIGSSADLNVGDEVLAIGNPLGELTFSLTTGVISALNREITLSGNVTMDLIQTDCAINAGNSGGALFNMYGEVIGITNAKYSSSSSSEASIDNIGFAIPISDVMDIVSSIIETGTYSTPYVGIAVGDSYSSRRHGAMSNNAGGCVITGVDSDSPAENVGLQVSDVITAVDGQNISGSSNLNNILSNSEIGETLVFTVYRNGETFDVEIMVSEKMQSALPETSSSETVNSPRRS